MVRHVLAALGVTVVAALQLGPSAAAQTADEQLAGYVGMAAGAAFSAQPVFPGLLPTGDAPAEVTAALSTANVKSGGNAYASAAAVWPGSAGANAGPLVSTAAGQPIFTQVVPPFPALVQANPGAVVNRGRVYLVDASGTIFPLDDLETTQPRLGLADVEPADVPITWTEVFPPGPVLSPDEARKPAVEQ